MEINENSYRKDTDVLLVVVQKRHRRTFRKDTDVLLLGIYYIFFTVSYCSTVILKLHVLRT
jgi:hypothetical protein